MVDGNNFMRVTTIVGFITISFFPTIHTPPAKWANALVNCANDGVAVQFLYNDCSVSCAIRVVVRFPIVFCNRQMKDSFCGFVKVNVIREGIATVLTFRRAAHGNGIVRPTILFAFFRDK